MFIRLTRLGEREDGIHYRPQLSPVDEVGNFLKLRPIRLHDKERRADAGILGAFA